MSKGKQNCFLFRLPIGLVGLNRFRIRLSVRRATALVLLVSLISPSVALAKQPGGITGVPIFNLSGTASLFSSFASLSETLGAWLGSPQGQGMPQSERPLPERKAPQLPPTKAEREARVSAIKLGFDGDLTIESGQRRILMAIPVDHEGSPIHGLLAEWESSDESIFSIKKDGRAVAGQPGQAKLTVSAGQRKVSVKVSVIKAAGAQQTASLRRAVTVTSSRRTRERKHHSSLISPTPQLPQSQGFGARLPDSEASSLYWAQNDVGAPPGRTEPGAATPPAAIAGTETPLSSNFAFGVPLVDLAGRGVDVKLALTYNSRLWHKSIDSGNATRLTYDVNSGWPAPGFQLGYGYIESHGPSGMTLVDADGTRHELRKSNPSQYDYNYDTVDGTFIHFKSDNGYYLTRGWLDYPNGGRAYYAGSTFDATISYPNQIMDRNGNYIVISYLASGLIDTIMDTLGRYIRFHYEYDPAQDCGYSSQCFHNSHKLVAITVPGFGDTAPGGIGSSPGRQAVRLYYDTISINPSGSFTVPTRAPATARVIRYIYFPGTQSGFRYDYSSYGMISGITQLRGMAVNSTALTQQGTVTSEGQIAATTIYNFPQTPSSLSDTPSYTQRSDDWAGRTSAQPVNYFSVNQAAGTATTTAPNGTITTTQTIVSQGQWNDGLVTDITQQGGGLTVTTHNAWETDSGGVNPRVQQAQVTNEANQTKTTQFTYTTYNNASVVRELGFNSEELRRTETTYLSDAGWTSRHLLRLPTSVKIFAGGATQPASRVDYTYDTDQNLTDRVGLVMHDESYDPNMVFRGNLIAVNRYINAADPNQGTVADTKAYDTVGNLISQTVNCCRVRAYDYFEGYFFANVTLLTQGDSQHQQSAVYDFNTGLMTQSTDQNERVTTYEYYPDSLRLYRTTRPDGGYTIMEYGDQLYADPDQSHLHSWTKTRTLIEGTNVSEQWKYVDGRGTVVRTFGPQTSQGRATTDIEYDAMGRVLRNSNPYYSQSGAASAINPAGLWGTRQYDSFSRVTQEILPDQTTAAATYAGSVMTVTDQANKSRRRVTDALGRMVRMDEPDASGNLGSVNSPSQPTSYQYDALNNLIHITQGAQHRYFKYDSLSRMTYERQPEQDAPHSAADALTGNSSWSRKIIYNGFNLVSQVTDARGVATNFTYDTLNRLTFKTYSDGSPTVEQRYDEVRYPDGGGPGYANRGRLTSVMVGSSGQIYQQFNYNPMGKVSMQRQGLAGNAFEIQNFYNQGGQLIEEWIRGERQQDSTYTLDEKRSYFYDVAGRLVNVNRGGHSAAQAAYASELSYNAAGALESLTYGNGATETKSYNSRLQLTSQSLVKAGTVLQRYDYQYGQVNQTTGAVDTQKNNGQLGRMDAFIGGTPQSPTKQWEERFSYDSLARLDVASEYRGDNGALTWQADYDYDRYGNRTRVSGTVAQAGSAGILPAMSAQRERPQSEPGAVATGSSVVIGEPRDPQVSLLTAQLTSKTDLALPEALRTAASRLRSNSHHASRTASTNTATPQGPPVFTDDPLVPGVTVIKAVHITELRTAVNQARAHASLAAASWAESVSAGVTLIKAAHIAELRARLDEARAALGLTAASYTDPTLTVGVTTVKAVHIQELRLRVTEALAANSTNTSYDTATNRITTAGITYDAAGQILTDALFRGLQYQYNPEGRMIWSANLDGSNPSSSVYDGTGQRVQTTQAGVTKRYFYDINGSVVAEYEANGGTGYGTLKRLNVSAGGRLLAVDEVQTDGSKVTSYIMVDRQGSTRVLMNAAGAVTSRHDYFPFGEELGAGTGAPGSPTGMRTAAQGYSTADNVRQRYANTRLDEATGLDHTLWRKLETRSGRWTTPDPYGKSLQLQDPQSFNRYSYVQNDPINFADPSGLNVAMPGGGCFTGTIWTLWYGSPGNYKQIGGPQFDGVWSDCEGGEGDPPPVEVPQNPLTDSQKEFAVNALTRASELLDKARCGNFIDALVQRAAEVAGRMGAYVSTNGSFGFNRATAQALYYDAINSGRVIASGQSGRSGNHITYGTTDPNNSHQVSWNNEFFDLGRDEAALQSLHEALHQIRYFDDHTLAGAASFVDSDGRRERSYAEGEAGGRAASQDLNNLISRYCSP